MTRYHAPLHRVRITTSSEDLATSVRRHADELFTIAEEVGQQRLDSNTAVSTENAYFTGLQYKAACAV
jgi:hypothetical protein